MSVFRHYLALTKPRLTLMAVAASGAGFWIGAGGLQDGASLLHLLSAMTCLGAALAALNQFLERHVDAQMPRTAGRPLPSGKLAPVQALVFGAVLLAIAVAHLFLAVNGLTTLLALATAILYLGCYLPLKPRTPWCVPVGAVPGAMPTVMGYTAATGRLDAGAAVLFAIMFLWQTPHFMAIGMLYDGEYRAAGLRVMPDKSRGPTSVPWQILLCSLGLIIATLWPTYVGIAGVRYMMVALILGFVFGAFAFEAAIGGTLPAARRLFLASIFYLPALLAAMALDTG